MDAKTISTRHYFDRYKSPVVLLVSQQSARFEHNGFGQALGAYREGLAKRNIRCLTIMPIDSRDIMAEHKFSENNAQEEIELKISGNLNGKFDKTLVAKSYYDEFGPVAMIHFNGDSSHPLGLSTYGNADRLSGDVNVPISTYSYGNESMKKADPYYSLPMTGPFLEYNLAVARFAEIMKETNPDVPFILHGNDHGTALAVALVSGRDIMKTVYTMHNPLFESTALSSTLTASGIHPAFFDRRTSVNLNMLACNMAGFVTTVSPSFAGEMADINNPLFKDVEKHRNFSALLSARKEAGTFLGILNGLPARMLEDRGFAFQAYPGSKLNILWANRPAAEKSFHEFLAAIQLLASRDHDDWKRKLQVTMLCETATRLLPSEDRDLIESLEKNKKIKFSYSSSYTEEAFLKAMKEEGVATVGILPSTIEPCGLTPAFLQAQKIPVIVNDAGGNLEALNGGATAIRLSAGENMTSRITSTISSLLEMNNLSSLNKMVEAAHESSIRDYDPGRVADDLISKVYMPLVKG